VVQISTVFIKYKPATQNCVPYKNITGPKKKSEGEELKCTWWWTAVMI